MVLVRIKRSLIRPAIAIAIVGAAMLAARYTDAQSTCPIPANAIQINCNDGQTIPEEADVVVLSGTCNLSANLNLASDETLEAAPGQTVTINGNGKYTVQINGVNGVSIYGIAFQSLGANLSNLTQVAEGGLILTNTSGDNIRWNTFLNCDFSCISGNGISNSVIDSNTIDGLTNEQNCCGPGRPVNNSAAININSDVPFNQRSGGGDVISNNFITNDPGSGIVFYGSNIDVTANVITNSGQELMDGGAIYTYSPATGPMAEWGDRITNNTILNFGGYSSPVPNGASDHGIYLDWATSGVLVSGNIVQVVPANPSTSTSFGASDIVTHDTGNIFTNNVFDVSGAQLLSAESDRGGTGVPSQFNNNIIYSSGRFASCPSCGGFDGVDYATGVPSVPPTFNNNDFYSPSGPSGALNLDPGASPDPAPPTNKNPNYNNPGYDPSTGTVRNPPAGFQPLSTRRGPQPSACYSAKLP